MAQPFQSHRLVLCEGIEDAAFLRELCNKRNLGSFDIRPVEDIGGIKGVTGFQSALCVAVQDREFKRVTRLILIADSDEPHQNTFAKICAQITRANQDTNVNGIFAVPQNPYELTGGHPRISILLFPAPNSKGALDTLLWSALKAIPAHGRVVDAAEQAVQHARISSGNSKWPQSKLDKALVRIAIALLNKDNPAVSISRLWRDNPNLIPVTHRVFDDLENVLSGI
ncbi:MAG TPA: DUF3226 domain-containing protein [Burkholderiales bacterium]|nr:DUF3226 domain-containing protein [Burkholderiales bacterium]